MSTTIKPAFMQPRLRLVLVTLSVIFFSFVTTQTFAQYLENVGPVTVTSDKPDYAPRSTATFTGKGFKPGESVVLKVKNLFRDCNTVSADSSYLPWTDTADADGNFVTTWIVCDCLGDSLRLKAVGQSSGYIAYSYFSDANISSISPASGSTSGGYIVTITASNSFNTGGAPYTVKFGTIFATSNATRIDNSNITVTVPAQSAGIVSVTVFDKNNNPTAQSGATFTYTNNAPIVSNVPKSGNEDNTLTFTSADFTGHFSDMDGDVLNRIKITSLPSASTGVLKFSGVAVAVNDEITAANIPNLTFEPAANYNGSASFGWNGSDGSLYAITGANVNITINAVNDAPVANTQSITTDEDTPANGALTGSDVDAGATLTYAVTQPAHGSVTVNAATGAFTYTPTVNYNGSDAFTFTVSDGALTSSAATVSITVNAVNDAPVSVNDSYSTNEDVALTVVAPGILGNDSDVDGDALTAVLVAGPANGTLVLNSNGSFTYTPAANFNGTDNFTYRASDGSLNSNLATVTITVNAVNDAPVLPAIGNKNVNELVALNFSITATDVDLPANTLTYSLVGAPVGASINSSTGAFTWTPTEAQGPGSYTFTVKVTDNGTPALSDEEEITVTVNEVNVAPVLATIGNKSVAWNNLLSFTATATDADVPANTLTYSLVGTIPAGASINSSTGAFTWTPTSAEIGSYTFTVRVTDNGTPNLSDEEVITVTVGTRPTLTVTTVTGSVQYSDPAPFTSSLYDVGNDPNYNNAGANSSLWIPLSNMTIGYTVTGQSLTGSALTNSSGLAVPSAMMINLAPNVSPATYQVNSSFAGTTLYGVSIDADNFIVTKENAIVDYIGSELVATVSTTNLTANIDLRVAIQDIDDGNRGDIRNATIKFVFDGVTVLDWTAISTLIDPYTGVISKAVTKTLSGASTSEIYQLQVYVNNYYTASTLTVPITVYVATGDFITGGGHIIPSASAGVLPSSPNSKTNFGFNVKYNKKGTSLQGKLNFVWRSGGRVYQAKSNATEALGVDITNANAKTASFTSKCTVVDITDPDNPIATGPNLGGNRLMQVTMTDRGEPGKTDDIGFTLWDGNTLVYSSQWTGTNTSNKLLTGGNLVVHSGFNVGSSSAITSSANPRIVESTIAPVTQSGTLNVQAYPNPAQSQFNIKLQSSNTADAISIIVYNVNGNVVETRKNLKAGQSLVLGGMYRPGIYILEMIQGNQRKQLKLVKIPD